MNALTTAFIYGLLYQIIDIAYLKSDEQVEASVISFACFGYKIGAAAAATITSLFLTIIGYDPNLDNAAGLAHIDIVLTWIPAALLFICILILKFFYPLREPLYRKIIEQKERKMEGKEYDCSEFEHLM